MAARAFTEQGLAIMERGASDEVERLCAEVRRLYAEEDSRARTEEAAYTLISSAHQQLHGAARTLEGALKMLSPTPEPTRQDQPARKVPPTLGGGMSNQQES